MQIDGVAAVTGAGQGIGLGVTTALARRGVDVLALVQEASMAEAVEQATAGLPGSVKTEVLDVTAPGDFAFPTDLQVLVNNAGIRLGYHPVEHISMEDWHRLFAVNFFGVVDMTRRAIPVLRTRGSGVICNVSSAALFSVTPFHSTYRASKAAVSNFCETLRVELAPFGIRVVEVMPGATVTGINVGSIVNTIADAVQYPPYAPMAHRIHEVFGATVMPANSPAACGEAIVDAIFDDGGPMRYGTDEYAVQALETWRRTPDEEMMAGVLERLLEPS